MLEGQTQTQTHKHKIHMEFIMNKSIILYSSLRAGQGKTTNAINYTRKEVLNGKRVLFVSPSIPAIDELHTRFREIDSNLPVIKFHSEDSSNIIKSIIDTFHNPSPKIIIITHHAFVDIDWTTMDCSNTILIIDGELSSIMFKEYNIKITDFNVTFRDLLQETTAIDSFVTLKYINEDTIARNNTFLSNNKTLFPYIANNCWSCHAHSHFFTSDDIDTFKAYGMFDLSVIAEIFHSTTILCSDFERSLMYKAFSNRVNFNLLPNNEFTPHANPITLFTTSMRGWRNGWNEDNHIATKYKNEFTQIALDSIIDYERAFISDNKGSYSFSAIEKAGSVYNTLSNPPSNHLGKINVIAFNAEGLNELRDCTRHINLACANYSPQSLNYLHNIWNVDTQDLNMIRNVRRTYQAILRGQVRKGDHYTLECHILDGEIADQIQSYYFTNARVNIIYKITPTQFSAFRGEKKKAKFQFKDDKARSKINRFFNKKENKKHMRKSPDARFTYYFNQFPTQKAELLLEGTY